MINFITCVWCSFWWLRLVACDVEPAFSVFAMILLWVAGGLYTLAQRQKDMAMWMYYAIIADERADRRQIEKLVAEWNRRLLPKKQRWSARKKV